MAGILQKNSTSYQAPDLLVAGSYLKLVQRLATPDTSGETWEAGQILIYDAAAASITSGEAQDYVMTNGMTLLVKVDDGAVQTATFNTDDFVAIGEAEAAEVAVVINTDISGVTASAVDGYVKIVSDLTGLESSIQITGGTANAVLGFSTEKVIGAGDKEVSKWDGTDADADEIMGVLAHDFEFDGTNEGVLTIAVMGGINAAKLLPANATITTAGGTLGLGDKKLEALNIYLSGSRA